MYGEYIIIKMEYMYGARRVVTGLLKHTGTFRIEVISTDVT